MGLGDILFGRRKLKDASPDRLFALSTAAVTLETELGLRTGGRAGVVFKPLSDAEKERYVAFGEWRDRSGGYAIQTLGSTLVERLEGSVSNVVGLPVGLLLELAPQVFTQA